MKINDSVKVKNGVTDPDIPSNNLSGWQGRIVEINTKDNLITVAWDSLTLQNYSLDLLMQTWDEEFTLMVLEADELELCTPRDTEKEAEEMQERILKWADFLALYETKATIYAEMFAGIDIFDEIAMFENWHKNIKEALDEPVDAELIDEQFEEIKIGTKLVVRSLDEYIDEKYGILANCKTPKRKALLPLCCCEPCDLDTESEMLIQDYVIWFANR